MTKIITIVSGKGGVGKTMVTANLGMALLEIGKDVTLIDGNLTTPNLGLHLGIPSFPNTLHDVLKGKVEIMDAVYEHDSGLKIVPAGLSVEHLKGIDPRRLSQVLLGLFGSTDIILIDAAAGIGREALAAIENSDEVLIVTNPELPAILDALKIHKITEEMGIETRGIVLNRISRKKHEMREEEITSLIELPILARIMEDENIKKAINQRLSIIQYKPYSYNSYEFRKLARIISGIPISNLNIPWYRRIFSKYFF
ncbi:MAG: cell division ATPase MinD [Candidatus Aenigmatarchaeota archaeon]|nr:cell division ATPase MinD [Candidatus Aenigmarchaeota archaeon]